MSARGMHKLHTREGTVNADPDIHVFELQILPYRQHTLGKVFLILTRPYKPHSYSYILKEHTP